MTPNQIKLRRLELGLSLSELAAALEITETELQLIESGQSDLYTNAGMEEAFALLEEREFLTFVGA
ncbi:MAG: helix-turn-helix domain-containing protein [Thermoanaerobaculia bacterium]